MTGQKTNVAEPERETLELPESCELSIREKNGSKYYFVLNYSGNPVTVGVKSLLFSLFDRVPVGREMVLEPFGTAVLKKG